MMCSITKSFTILIHFINNNSLVLIFLFINEIQRLDFLLKQVCRKIQSLKAGMANGKQENVLKNENFKELLGFIKYGASRQSFLT